MTYLEAFSELLPAASGRLADGLHLKAMRWSDCAAGLLNVAEIAPHVVPNLRAYRSSCGTLLANPAVDCRLRRQHQDVHSASFEVVQNLAVAYLGDEGTRSWRHGWAPDTIRLTMLHGG